MTNIKQHQAELEGQLNHFDPSLRRKALQELLAFVDSGNVSCENSREIANMHCHTFFSFNAYGYSPTGLAWLAKKNGYKLIGKVDFDVLDGVEEFLEACDLAGVRASAAIETRVFFPEFSTRELNSPGEPGVYYHMGIGLALDRVPEPGRSILSDMQQRSASRNREIVNRLNHVLNPVNIDYEGDVLPLTPAGNATERHILAAILKKASESLDNPNTFWAQKLSISDEALASLMQNGPAFQNQVRTRFMKKGGPGYVQPGESSFPSVNDFHRAVTACEGLICAAWLDGLSNGEQAMAEELEILVGRGAVALNIIPDRNWNVPDPQLRKTKIKNLYDVVELAGGLDLPINVGTEMNTFGQKLVDDFDVPEMAPVRHVFLDGAYFVYGQTVMQRTLGLGYHSDFSREGFNTRKDRNEFYTKIGRLIPPGSSGQQQLRRMVSQKKPNEKITPNLFMH